MFLVKIRGDYHKEEKYNHNMCNYRIYYISITSANVTNFKK